VLPHFVANICAVEIMILPLFFCPMYAAQFMSWSKVSP
jgi:hypothetical protein